MGTKTTQSEDNQTLEDTRNKAFLERAKLDLAEVLGDADPCIKVFVPEVQDVPRQFCLVLLPYAGTWKGLRLHFNVEWTLEGSRQWPLFPPRIQMDSGIGFTHPSFLHGTIDLTRTVEFNTVAEDGTEIVWTLKYEPSYTLQYLFAMILHLLSASKVAAPYPALPYLLEQSIVGYLDEESFKRSQSSVIGSCCQISMDILASDTSLQASRKVEWDADPRPDILFCQGDFQMHDFRHHEQHSVKTLDPGPGRLHQFAYPNPKWIDTFESMSSINCERCPYGSPPLPQTAPSPTMLGTPPNSLLVPPPSCMLDILTDDSFLAISNWLATSSTRAFAAAYVRFDQLISENHVLQARDLQCSLLRTSYRANPDTIFGVRFVGEGDKLIQWEWLSLKAFKFHDCILFHQLPTDVHERPSYFIPLAINPKHFGSAQDEITNRLDLIDKFLTSSRGVPERRRKCNFCDGDHFLRLRPRTVRQLFGRLPRIQSIIVLMENVLDQLHKTWIELRPRLSNGEDEHDASHLPVVEAEQTVARYCQLLYLALSMCRSDPRIVAEAKSVIWAYVLGNDGPCDAGDHGQIIALLVIVSILDPVRESEQATPAPERGAPLSWSVIRKPFLRSFIGWTALRWLHWTPALGIMEEGVSEFRLSKTFENMEWDLWRLSSHIAFFRAFTETYSGNVEMLDESYGFVDARLLERLIGYLRNSGNIRTWRGFFRQVQFVEGEEMGQEGFCEILRGATKDASSKRKATYPETGTLGIRQLIEQKAQAEAEWKAKAATPDLHW